MRYKIVDRYSTSRIQSIEAPVPKMVVSVIDVRPRATIREEMLAMINLQPKVTTHDTLNATKHMANIRSGEALLLR